MVYINYDKMSLKPIKTRTYTKQLGNVFADYGYLFNISLDVYKANLVLSKETRQTLQVEEFIASQHSNLGAVIDLRENTAENASGYLSRHEDARKGYRDRILWISP